MTPAAVRWDRSELEELSSPRRHAWSLHGLSCLSYTCLQVGRPAAALLYNRVKYDELVRTFQKKRPRHSHKAREMSKRDLRYDNYAKWIEAKHTAMGASLTAEDEDEHEGEDVRTLRPVAAAIAIVAAADLAEVRGIGFGRVVAAISSSAPPPPTRSPLGVQAAPAGAAGGTAVASGGAPSVVAASAAQPDAECGAAAEEELQPQRMALEGSDTREVSLGLRCRLCYVRGAGPRWVHVGCASLCSAVDPNYPL